MRCKVENDASSKKTATVRTIANSLFGEQMRALRKRERLKHYLVPKSNWIIDKKKV